MITPLADIGASTTGVSIKCAICIDACTMLYGTDQGSIVQSTYYNQAVKVGTSSSTSLSGIALYSGASAIACYNGSSRFDLIDLATLQVTPVTTGANPSYTASNGQQIAANPNTGFAAVTRAGTNALSLINCVTRAASSISLTGFSNQTTTCVIVKGNNFLVGSNQGSIYEINTNGTIINSFRLPRTASNNSTPNYYPIVSLAYDASSTVIAAHSGGSLVAINWTTSSIINELPTYENTYPGANVALSNYSSGVILQASDSPGSRLYCAINELFFNPKGLKPLDTTYINSYILSGTHDLQIDPTGTKGFILSNDINGNTFKIRTFSITPTGSVLTKTRAQDPIGVDITGSVIRIRDRGYGKTVIDLEQTITAGDNYPIAADGNNYIEVLLNGASGASEKWDVREFTA